MRPRILLADDHAMVAEGLALLVGEIGDIVGRVNDGLQLVEAARRLRPDVVVSDVSMPGMSGIDAMRTLKAEGHRARFVLLTIYADSDLAAEAIRAGASAYLLKQSAGEELLDAIRAVVGGRTYLTPVITQDVIRSLDSSRGAAELTARQREVLRMLAQGKRIKEIAADLGISVRTVEDHKAHLMRTLNLESTADLVRFAIKQRIVPSE